MKSDAKHGTQLIAKLSAGSILLVATALMLSGGAWAQATPPAAGSTEYQPRVGQEGKDVIWVPTPPGLVERMLQLAQTTPKDFVVDLGSGDGRIPIAAVKQFGARAMGIEYNPDLVALSIRNAREAGVGGRAQMVEGDIFEKDFTSATVVTLYLLTELNLRLRPKLLDMKPGTRLVAHLFGLGDWIPDETSNYDGRPAYMWVVPARANGRWKVTVGAAGNLKGTKGTKGTKGNVAREFTLDIEQRFQMISGTASFGRMNTTLRDPLLRADAIRFSVTDVDGKVREYAGRIAGATMRGEMSIGSVAASRSRQRWHGERIEAPKP